MSSQIERLKDKSIQIMMPLVKKRISEFVIDEIVEVDEKFKDVAILFQDIETKEALDALKSFLQSHKAALGRDLYDDCAEELREMTSDLKWSRSKRGNAVLTLEDWVVDARQQLSAKGEFDSIFIGRDWNDPTLLVISGVLANNLQPALKAKIKELNPPVEPLYILEQPFEG